MFGYETLFPHEGLASQTMAYVLVRLTQMRCRLVVAFGFVVPLTLMQLVYNMVPMEEAVLWQAVAFRAGRGPAVSLADTTGE